MARAAVYLSLPRKRPYAISGKSGGSRCLEPQQEYIARQKLAEHGDRNAAHQLVTSHLRLVPRSRWAIAATGCHLEVISEGNVG